MALSTRGELIRKLVLVTRGWGSPSNSWMRIGVSLTAVAGDYDRLPGSVVQRPATGTGPTDCHGQWSTRRRCARPFDSKGARKMREDDSDNSTRTCIICYVCGRGGRSRGKRCSCESGGGPSASGCICLRFTCEKAALRATRDRLT
jgi:hypothetical protein